ncbi:NlpC/P60 family protein [Ammoniphilus sp. 3BR4]|uniref:C40 family peptidase n=1 Tax=Ammoniphilus sp. 3BR4 TaxID=3158265 RepID=UPI0034673B88
MIKKIIIGLLSSSLLLSGCASQPNGAGTLGNQNNGSVRLLQNQPAPATRNDQSLPLIVDGENTGNIGVISQADQVYIPLDPFFQTLGYTVTKTNGEIQVGYTDPIFTVTEDSTRAVTEEREIDLPHAVTSIGTQSYITLPSLAALLGTAYNVQLTGDSLLVTFGESVFPEDNGWENFQENEDADAAPAVSRAKANRIISHGKKFLGVKYVFGARTGRTSAFDCSSYTQYLYGKQGVRIPRTARAQAKRGSYVKVANLKPGDLLFFSVPGRFRNDRTPGHVGIYMGNGRMIHAVPPRVTITNISKSRYWKRTYLGARRVS